MLIQICIYSLCKHLNSYSILIVEAEMRFLFLNEIWKEMLCDHSNLNTHLVERLSKKPVAKAIYVILVTRMSKA
jgi:hypothetical protein